MRVLVVSLVSASTLTICLASGQRQADPAPPVNVIGYYADWTANRYPLAEIPAEKLTHVNYAFAKVGTDNRLTLIHPEAAIEHVYPDDCSDPGCAHGLFHQITLLKQKHPHLKFIMSVGGWTDSGGFYEMAATEDGRRTFADSCAKFLETYPQFDGIDIDWEHPVVGGLQKNLGQPRDARNYVLLLAAVRQAIGPTHLLTIAAGAGPNAIAPLEYAEMAASLDWVSVMTYDFHTGGPRTGYNAPLYDHDDPDNPKHNLHEAVQSILAKGVPPAKLAAGIPFYGHGWRGVEAAGVWSAATGTAPSGNYRTLAANFVNVNGYVRYWDDVAKVPWLYNAEKKEWISYDDPESVRIKGEYIAGKRLGGAMFWELSGDDGPLLDALRTGLGLAAPGVAFRN